jgi:hypothetical protein
LYFGNLTAYFATKAGICTKPSAILFFTFKYYRNLAPDRQIKKRCCRVAFNGSGSTLLLGGRYRSFGGDGARSSSAVIGHAVRYILLEIESYQFVSKKKTCLKG